MSRRESIDKIERVLAKAYNISLGMEEKALRESDITDISLIEVRTLNAVGMDRLKTMGEIAEAVSISISTLTIAINKLEKKGYVKKMKCDKDKRIVRVELTEKGRYVVRKHRVLRRRIASKMLFSMETKEVESLAKTLEELDAYLDTQEG